MFIGIFGGTFDPPHYGHIQLAQYLIKHSPLDEIWFMVSPENPLKKAQNMSAQEHRLTMVQLILKGQKHLHASDFEFSLPKPSFTLQTLNCLTTAFPQHQFALIIGADNMQIFHHWHKHQTLIEHFPIFVYPRNNIKNITFQHRNIHWCNAPERDISSTEIRTSIKNNINCQQYTSEEVVSFIKNKKLY